MNKPASLSTFPSVSVLPNNTLVNGRLQNSPKYSADNSSTSRGSSVELSDILSRLQSAEGTIVELIERLNSASISAGCEDGSVTVELSI